ncbi:MAG: flagellar basal body rod protein FlgB [Pirellula sp.]
MFPNMFSNSALKSLEQTASFAERRHAILAGNIANMDTPDYKTKDLSVDSFQSNLREAIQAERRSQEIAPGMRLGLLGATDEATIPSIREAKDVAVQNVKDSMRQIVYHDGSDDSLELQATQLVKNQSMHTAAIAMMRSQFRQLQMAISGSINV